jgi:hypothetical protein
MWGKFSHYSGKRDHNMNSFLLKIYEHFLGNNLFKFEYQV